MRKIPLSNGKYAIVDAEDYTKVSKYKWSETKLGHRRTSYARTNIKEGEKYRTESLHRLILGLSSKDGNIVDHINGNGLDNRKINLRLSSPRENAVNVKTRRDNTSGYKGVSFRKDRGTWRVEIKKNYKTVFNKTTRCIHLAGLIYNDNVKEIHGKYAWTNKIKECECYECTSYKRARDTG